MVSVPALLMPPPELPALLPERVELLKVSVPRFRMPAPAPVAA